MGGKKREVRVGLKGMSYNSYTLHERPDLIPQVNRLGEVAWPKFLLHGDVRHWDHLSGSFRDFQVVMCDRGDQVAAIGHMVPLNWDGSPGDLPTTIDDIILQAVHIRKKQLVFNTVSALAVVVAKEYQGQGLSTMVLRKMTAIAEHYDCTALIVPVRPTWKSRYPLIRFERYCAWTREDGAPFDPWIRVHWQLGAEKLRISQKTLTVTGTIAQWEEWTGIQFPDSGEYVVPGALQPVKMDRERNLGVYEDAYLWMKHQVHREA